MWDISRTVLTLLTHGRLKSEIHKGKPYTRAARGPRSKGMRHARQIRVEKMFEDALGQFYGRSARVGRPWPARCSLCAPHKSRANGAMVGQELDQLMSAVLEGPIYQGIGSHEIPPLLPTAPDTWPMALAPPRLPLRISGIYAGDRPRADRGRANAVDAVECIDLAAAGLAPSYLASPGDWGWGI
jgi:hypothetical protein